MREPTQEERQTATILLEKMTLDAEAYAVLKRISAGEMVRVEALILLRSLGDTYAREKFGDEKPRSA